MEQALKHFRLDAPAVSCERYGCGHINKTFLAVTASGRRYILQRINASVFPDRAGLMENISAVIRWLAAQGGDERSHLTLVPTLEGDCCWTDPEGEVWRLYNFIEDSLCLQLPETPEDFYQSAVAFGGFQARMAGFPAEKLHETIPDFHNTPDRYRKFHAALRADPEGRAQAVEKEISFFLAREAEAGELQRLRQSGALPLRVTHNDTKLNNVMLDAVTRKALCVIDLDTVMPGLAAYDFGDSIRFGASTAAEDEPDLSKVEMDLSLFGIYVRGFVEACPSLTPLERETLPLGAKLMTLECGLRFLTDYLQGDTYFHTDYPEHNLVRARTQIKLVEDMERKWGGMEKLVRDI